MKIYKYKHTPRQALGKGLVTLRLVNKHLNLFSRLKEKYGEKIPEDHIKHLLENFFAFHPRNFMDVESNNLKWDTTVLDLGCGSIGESSDYTRPKGFDLNFRDFEPWFPRALHEIGIKCIGIDCGNLEGEEFEHYSLDLLTRNLDFIPDHSIDYAHSRLLYSSPELSDRVRVTDQKLRDEVKDKEIPYWSCGDHERYSKETLKKIILPQLERIVKPNGVFVYTD